MVIRLFFLFLAAFLLSVAPVQAGIIAIDASRTGDVIELKLGAHGAEKVFFLNNPERLVVDAPLAGTPKIALPKNYSGNLLKSIRAGRFDADTIRIVFDLQKPCTLVSKEQNGDMLTLAIAAAGSSKEKPKPELPVVVIDPGHGGEDPGAIGPRGSQEKDVVLAFGIALRDALLATGKYKVKMTRESDFFIPLRERVRIAREAKGSIFISIHADSAPNEEARGLSIYTVSEKASDAEAEALAARENKVDVLGGMDLSNERQDVADILISLAQRDTKNQSALLADKLVMSLERNVRTLSNAHRFAGFAVLKAPDIPSVLIETGFISHPAEEKLLKTREYREKLISGIVRGVNEYFAKKGGILK